MNLLNVKANVVPIICKTTIKDKALAISTVKRIGIGTAGTVSIQLNARSIQNITHSKFSMNRTVFGLLSGGNRVSPRWEDCLQRVE